MSNTNTEVLTTAYEKLQGALTQSNTVLPELQEAVEKGNLDNYATVSQLEEKANKDDVANISSGTPLFASAVSEMIDTTRNYVNTTDGYLYTYNSTTNEFEKSTIQYQATGLNDKSIFAEKLAYNFITCTSSSTISIDWGLKNITFNQSDLVVNNSFIRIKEQVVVIPDEKLSLLCVYAKKDSDIVNCCKYSEVPVGSYIFLILNTWVNKIVYNPNKSCIKNIKNNNILLEDNYIDVNINSNEFLHEYGIFTDEAACTLDLINHTFSINHTTNLIIKNKVFTVNTTSIDLTIDKDEKRVIVLDKSDFNFKIRTLSDVKYEDVCILLYDCNIKSEYRLLYCAKENNVEIISEKCISNGTDLQDMNFKLKCVKTSKNMFMPVYEEDFNTSYGYFELLKKVDGFSDDINIEHKIENGTFKIINKNNTSTNTRLIKTIFDCNLTSKTIEIDVDKVDDSIRLGIVKDSNNYILYKLDYKNNLCRLDYSFNGVTGYRNGGELVTPPCKLQFRISNPSLFLLAQKNGQWKTLTDVAITTLGISDKFDIRNEPSNWKFSFGATFENAEVNKECIISNLKIGYSSGMCMGADYKFVRYENGEPYIEDGCVFLTATEHSSNNVNACGGINIYKLNLKNYKIEFTGRMLSTINDTNYTGNGKITGDASATILYNRIDNLWYVSTSCFGLDYDNTRILIGARSEKPLYGENVISMGLLKASPENNSPMWDFDFVYVPSKKKYYGAMKKGWVYSTDNPLGEWTKIHDVEEGFEGCSCTKVNGKYIYTTAYESANETLNVNDLLTNVNLGQLNIDIYPKHDSSEYKYSTPTWGSVLPYYDNGRTYYYCVLFSLRNFEGRNFTYGDMWIYRADESNIGKEF